MYSPSFSFAGAALATLASVGVGATGAAAGAVGVGTTGVGTTGVGTTGVGTTGVGTTGVGATNLRTTGVGATIAAGITGAEVAITATGNDCFSVTGFAFAAGAPVAVAIVVVVSGTVTLRVADRALAICFFESIFAIVASALFTAPVCALFVGATACRALGDTEFE